MRRFVRASLFVAALCVVSCVAVLLFPKPLYAHHVRSGRLSLYCDRPFDPETGHRVLLDVERRLSAAPPVLRDPASEYTIFVSRSAWRKRLTFLWNRGGGINYYPIAGNVFLGQGDIDGDRIFHSDGTPVASPRTLAYYASHEIAHSLIGKRIGAIANWRLPAWEREGLADYVAFAGDVDVPALTRELRAGDPTMDPKRSGLYSRYRLLVAYYLADRGWSVDRLLASHLSIADAEQPLLQEHQHGLRNHQERRLSSAHRSGQGARDRETDRRRQLGDLR